MNIKTNDRAKIVWLPIALFFIYACNLAGTQAAPPAGATANPTTGSGPQVSPEVGVVPSETVAVPTATLTATLTPTFTIVHLTTPPGTTGTTRYITDFKTKDYAPQKKAIGGDEYHNNRYERPFTADTMDYLGDVDLIRVEMRIASPWVYITFEFVEPRAEGIGQTMYGAEFDTNKDGRGDYLIWGASPKDGNWTTDGVEAWKDANFNVGGPTPQAANAPWELGDGYEKNLVASGVGDDPDLAWIRQTEGGKKAQLAFKYSAIANAAQFLWNGVADLGVRNPAWFDYNDHFTQADAGSPLPIQTQFYPLKALFGIDNTCRDAFGFTPIGTEPGLCMYYGSISGVVFRDYDENGVKASGEPVINLGTVNLGQGGCMTSGFKSAAGGAYAFNDLLIGNYCVSHMSSFPDPTYHRTTISEVTVHLAPNDAKVVNFGINWIDPIF